MEDFFYGATTPSGPGLPHYQGFTITLGDIIHGRTHLDEWSARRRDLYLTTHNILERQDFQDPAGFETAITASERPQTHTFDRAAAGRVEYCYLVARRLFYFYCRDVSPCRSSSVVIDVLFEQFCIQVQTQSPLILWDIISKVLAVATFIIFRCKPFVQEAEMCLSGTCVPDSTFLPPLFH